MIHLPLFPHFGVWDLWWTHTEPHIRPLTFNIPTKHHSAADAIGARVCTAITLKARELISNHRTPSLISAALSTCNLPLLLINSWHWRYAFSEARCLFCNHAYVGETEGWSVGEIKNAKERERLNERGMRKNKLKTGQRREGKKWSLMSFRYSFLSKLDAGVVSREIMCLYITS